MSTNISLFAQVIRLLPRALIKKLSTEFQVDKHSKHFTSWQHLVSMIFSQFSGCVSLREISNGLRSAIGNLNHQGIHTVPSKSGLSERASYLGPLPSLLLCLAQSFRTAGH